MDLNVIIEEDKIRDKDATIIAKIKTAIKLGYRVIAFNVCIGEDDIVNLPRPPDIKIKKIPGLPELKILTRVTISIDDIAKIHKLNQSTVVKQYDLLAIEPLSEKVLSQLCGGHLDCDIITFFVGGRTKVNIKKANFTLPQSRGVCFELNYSQLLADSTSRQNVIAAGYVLCSKTRGKNILLSSGARTPLQLRGTLDVANLGLLFELPEHKAKDAVFRNGHNAIKHSTVRKNPVSNAIQIESDIIESEKWIVKELVEASDSSKIEVTPPPKKLKI